LSDQPTLTTDRLTLRALDPADYPAFEAMHRDPAVMATLGPVMDPAAIRDLFAIWRGLWAARGWPRWAVAAPGMGFAGVVGLSPAGPGIPHAPAPAAFWRFVRPAWGNGIATEAARAAIGWLFRTRPAAEVLGYTTPGNARSQRVMDRLGLIRDARLDFDHPAVPAGHELQRHWFYRQTRAAWARAASGQDGPAHEGPAHDRHPQDRPGNDRLPNETSADAPRADPDRAEETIP